MKVRSGWSSEYARKKYDVELEEADLARILATGQVPPEAQASLALADAHNLLWFSAEIMARQTLASHDPSLKKNLQAEAHELNQQRAVLLGKVRERWEKEGLPAQLEAIRAARQQVKDEMQGAGWPPHPIPLEDK